MAAGDPGDERVVVLDSIAAGFALPIAGRDIASNFDRHEATHFHRGHDSSMTKKAGAATLDGDAGDDDLRGAGEEFKHSLRIFFVFGLSENAVAESDDG